MPDLLTSYKKGKNKISLLDAIDYSRSRKEKKVTPSFLCSKERIDNYTNDYLYQCEKAFLKWVKEKAKDEKWCKTTWMRRYKYSMLIREIFGRDYDRQIDRRILQTSQMFSHYSSRTYNNWYDAETGKTSNQNSYLISPSRWEKVRPWSIKLQVEQLHEQGIQPTRENTGLSKPLKIGSARYDATKAKIKKRQDRGRKAYEEWQRRQNEMQ